METMWQHEGTILLNVMIAAVLGGTLGFEREHKNKPAGIRTNMLISAASCLLLSLGRTIAFQMEESLPPDAMGVDPTRIIHAIIVGVSVIGAGTIWKSVEETSVRYLTTAATILFSAGAGMCIGLGLYITGIGITIIGLIINLIIGWWAG